MCPKVHPAFYNRVTLRQIGQFLQVSGSYFDLVDRFWIQVDPDRYSRCKLLRVSWNSQKPGKPKGKHQKAPKPSIRITDRIDDRLLSGKSILQL